jgi:hypothetical protein
MIDVGVIQLCHVLDVHFGASWHCEPPRRFPVQNPTFHITSMNEIVKKVDFPAPEESIKYAVPFKSALVG